MQYNSNAIVFVETDLHEVIFRPQGSQMRKGDRSGGNAKWPFPALTEDIRSHDI